MCQSTRHVSIEIVWFPFLSGPFLYCTHQMHYTNKPANLNVQHQCNFTSKPAQAPWGATPAKFHNQTCRHGNPEAGSQPTPTQVAETPASATATSVTTTGLGPSDGAPTRPANQPGMPVMKWCGSHFGPAPPCAVHTKYIAKPNRRT